MRSCRPLLVLLGITVLSAALVVFPVQAITNGSFDEDNFFSNVGTFVIQGTQGGPILPYCSGTLIAPDVFLTAAHCTWGFPENAMTETVRAAVCFDNLIPYSSKTDLTKTHLIYATHLFINPRFNQQRLNDSGDFSILLLPEGSTSGITPAVLPTEGLLDELAADKRLHDAVLTAVGYGEHERVLSGGPPTHLTPRPFLPPLPNPLPRKFAFPGFHALTGGYLMLSQNPATGDGGQCYGDSGGPDFLEVDGQLVLVGIVNGTDPTCHALNLASRLDTESVREFLGQYVTLP